MVWTRSMRTTRLRIGGDTSRNQEQNMPPTSEMTGCGENGANLTNEETDRRTTSTVDKTCVRKGKSDLEFKAQQQQLEKMEEELRASNAAHSRLERSHRREQTKMKLNLGANYILRRLRTT